VGTVRRWRRALEAVVGVLVLGWCAACTSTVSGHGTPSRDQVAAPPAFGTCWELRTSGFGTALDQPKRRPCSRPHDVETVWVATNALPTSRPYPTLAQTENSSGVVGTALDDACDYITVDTYLGDEAGRHVPYVSWEARLPSREQWAAGARWIRCDVVYGVDRPQLAPGRMSGGLKGPKTVDYRACYAGTPTDYAVVPCSRAHDGEIFAAGVEFPDDLAFPTQDRTRQAMAESTCGRELDETFSPSPRPAGFRLDLYLESEDPAPGQFTVSCVLVRTDGGRSTTVVLP
jgi:Septum formation